MFPHNPFTVSLQEKQVLIVWNEFFKSIYTCWLNVYSYVNWCHHYWGGGSSEKWDDVLLQFACFISWLVTGTGACPQSFSWLYNTLLYWCISVYLAFLLLADFICLHILLHKCHRLETSILSTCVHSASLLPFAG